MCYDLASPCLRRAQARPAAAPPGRPLAHPTRGSRCGPWREAVPGQAAVEPLLQSPDRRPGRDDRHPGGHAGQARRRPDAAVVHGRAQGHCRRGHDVEDAATRARRHAHRVRADAVPGPRDAVHLVAGGLWHGVPVLCDRPGWPAAQPVDRGDRGPGADGCRGHARRRPARRSRPAVEHRVHGHGRAARELQAHPRGRSPHLRSGAGRPGDFAAPRDGVDGRAGARDQES